jgi:hypothetical protein
MPIEIRELIIRAEINSGTQSASDSGGQGVSEALLQEMVDRVLESIKNQKER